ncbi:MAG TPA: carbon starvation CstA 5TM domain-containing protein [Dissulfurispiraceae bacterium]|nr:carbon starvation CstA 5TM domain-containing protein [Dissulfurispiraceae bacterium]
MFEAVFILTAVDAGTRVGRFLLQEMFGKVVPKFAERKWVPGVVITGALFTGSWGYLVYTGDIRNIWPLFGMSNQLLAASALIIVTSMLIRMGKVKYMWVTALPGLILASITMYAGYLQITMVYLAPGKENYLLATMACMVIVMIVIVLVACFKRWIELLSIKERVIDIWGESVIMPLPGEAVCLINDPKEGGAAIKGATEKWG